MIKTPVLVLLAGGKSDRMGFPKGLLTFNHRHWILEQISRFKDISEPKVYIGLGFDFELYLEHIPWFNNAISNTYVYDGVEVKVVINRQPKLGAFSTLQTVLSKINVDTTVLVQPIDVPLLNSKELQKLLRLENNIVIPFYNSKNGHPVKLSSEFWRPLLGIQSINEKARLDVQIKDSDGDKISYCEVFDEAVLENLNNKETWKKYVEKKGSTK